MLMNTLLKQLVNLTKPNFKTSSVNNLTGLCKHYRIEYSSNLTAYEVEKHLYKLIQDSLVGTDLYVGELFSLKDQLLLTHFVNLENLQPYLGILEIIIDAIRTTGSNPKQSIQQIVSLESKQSWRTVIKIAWDITVINPKRLKYNLQDLEEIYKRQLTLSKSAKTLRAKGCDIELKNGKVLIEELQRRNIANCIEADIKLLGGIRTLERLFDAIEPKYCKNQDRYRLGRTFKGLVEVDFPKIPVGYLLNLCVKFPRRQMQLVVENSCDVWDRVLQNSIALTSILDTQPYTAFSLLFHDHETIISFIRELAVYDSLFCPPQLRSSDVSRILRGLFAWCSEDTKQKLGWTPDQAAIVAEKIFELTSSKPILATFKSAQIYELIPQVQEKVIDKLLTIFSHDENSVNSCFQLPQDVARTKNCFQFKPLIKLNQDKYLLVNPPICSSAFYEAVVSELRDKAGNETKEKLGKDGVKSFIKNEFSQHEIKFSCGEYSINKGKQLEIDIVVETSDTIIFLEIKSKPLTRKSKDGNDLDLLVDLSKSLVESQIQLINHEVYIRENKTITLKDGYILKLNNRNIVLVSISLLDFGSFQDKTFIHQFLKIMLFSKIGNIHSVNATKISYLNEKLNDLKSLVTKIVQLDPNKLQHPFHNCWFLSVPQLLILLDNVNSNDDLKQELWRTRGITINSLDFYREYDNARQIAQARISRLSIDE